MNSTIKDICRATGYSTATVSRVLNNSPLVKETTKKEIKAALDKMRYQPNHAARALKLRRTGMVAVVFPDLDNGFFTDVLRGVDEMASEFGVHLLTAFTHGPTDEQEMITRMIQERRTDALILMNLTLPDEFIRNLSNSDIPLLLIDRPLPRSKLGTVSIDNRGGAEAMTRHLIAQGHQDIAFVTGAKGSYDADERLAAFRKTMKACGLAVPASSIWQGDFTENSGVRAMEKRLLEGKPLPDAIFAANDAMAVGIHQVLVNAGKKVPDDVALVGFDDADGARLLGLTTVKVPMRLMGRQAARQALEAIEKKGTSRHEVLPTRLIVRESCRHSLAE